MRVPPRIRDVDPGSVALDWRIAVLAVVILFAAARLLEVLTLPIPLCLWKSYTGLPCPFCGGTRAMIALSHGDFVGAFMFNPLAVALPAGLLGTAVGSLASRGGAAIFIRFRHDWVWTLLVANWLFVILGHLAQRH